MSTLTRFGISLDSDLLSRFDQLIEQKGYANRSEAIRDLIRGALVDREWEDGQEEKVGTITLLYDHHRHEVTEKLTQSQHDHHDQILSTMHIHLDHDNCLEVLAIKGEPGKLRSLADALIGMKGVKHGKLVTTTTGKNLK
jgi:CopG family nickel-responsive transcriptional regulator